jgi:hypothetical protein
VPNSPQKTSVTQNETDRSDPPFELVFERRFLVSVFTGLKSLAERGGSALGDVYALAATSVLNRSERFEDLNAERKFHQRSRSNSSSSARAAVRAPAPDPQASSLIK